MSRQKLFSVVLIGKSVLVREGISRILRASNVCTLASTPSIACLPETIAETPLLFVLLRSGHEFEDILQQATVLHRQYPTYRTAILADTCKPEELVLAYHSGVTGFFSTAMACDAFIKSLELVIMGQTIFPYSLLPFMPPSSATNADGVGDVSATAGTGADGATPQLSARERSILDFLIKGYPNKSIARKINISEATVKVHVKAILRKIRVQNRTQAAIWAMNNGFLARPHEEDTAKISVHHSSRHSQLLPVYACDCSGATASVPGTISRNNPLPRQLPVVDRLI